MTLLGAFDVLAFQMLRVTSAGSFAFFNSGYSSGAFDYGASGNPSVATFNGDFYLFYNLNSYLRYNVMNLWTLYLVLTNRNSSQGNNKKQLSYFWSSPLLPTFLLQYYPPVITKGHPFCIVLSGQMGDLLPLNAAAKLSIEQRQGYQGKAPFMLPANEDMTNKSGVLWWPAYQGNTRMTQEVDGFPFRITVEVSNAGSGIDGTYTVDPEMVVKSSPGDVLPTPDYRPSSD